MAVFWPVAFSPCRALSVSPTAARVKAPVGGSADVPVTVTPILTAPWDNDYQLVLDVVRRADKRVTFRTVKQNEIIGVSNAMGLTPCTVDVVAGAPTRVVLVPGELLRSLVPRYPEIAFRSLDYMGALLGRLSDEVERLHHASLEDRVLDRLRSLSAGRAEIVVTHEELAQQVAARRESVSRVLSALARRRMIRAGRGRITVLDLGRGA